MSYLLYISDKSSSSVSHLVENEIPLASVLPGTPTKTAAADRRLKMSQNSVNEIQISPLDLNEIISESSEGKKSMNGNYSLMSDKIAIDNNLTTPNNKTSTSMILPNISNGTLSDMTMSQNVYSNIPPTSPSVPNILKNAAADHVYSNIDETITNLGSSYMSDNIDLDLDDPLLTSSFSKNKEKPNSSQIIYNTSVSSEIQPNNNVSKAISSFSSSSSTTGTQITSIELKNVLKNVVLQQQAPAVVDSSPAILSPSSLRQTMIDTALDLDSLDGSSIENNSQVGLMSSKTAIV